ncbi:MAG: PASTA domain-containing protein, partial [Acidimicrobiia bacterium]|nr:PASTA domain-containing protein [Acidimicrobiia bacterium]
VDRTRAIPAATTAMTEERPRRRTGAYVVLLLVLLALPAGGLFLLAHELGLGSSAAADVTVPTVINQPVDQATTALTSAGLKVKTQSVDSDQQAGTVLDQNPKPDTKAHKGDTVTLSVRKGPPQVMVPPEIGKTIDDATNDLQQLGLTPVTSAENSPQPAGTVLNQNPPAGTQVAKNSTVTLVVSSGTGQATVPNVVGQDAGTAGATLDQAGFKVSTRTEPSDTVQAGLVASTSPPGGAKATKGSTVTMIVSSGPAATTTTEAATTTTSGAGTATVPDVIGSNRAPAAAALRNAGFAPSWAANNCPSASSTVVNQNPPGGTSAPAGSSVFLTC